MKKKIAVVGSSNVDLLMKMDHLPAIGETVTNGQFHQVFGGKGANQAVAAARAGGDVVFINCVGEDAYTHQMIQNFISDGIDVSYIFHEKGVPSGHALIMVGNDGNNYLSVAPGANYLLTPEKIEKARHIIEEAAMLIIQYEIHEETIKYLINLASEKKIPIIWNFAPARSFDHTYLPKVSTLIVNELEASHLSGTEVLNEQDAEKAAAILLDKGIETVIITLGSKGLFALTKKEKEKYHVLAYKVKAIDTTAAGDTFCGAFAVAMVEGKKLIDSLKFATAASAISVTRLGAQTSIPYRNEIDMRIKSETLTFKAI